MTMDGNGPASTGIRHLEDELDIHQEVKNTSSASTVILDKNQDDKSIFRKHP